MKKLKSIFFAVLYLGVLAILFDIFSSYALIYFYRYKDMSDAIGREKGTLSSVIFARRVIAKLIHEKDEGKRYIQPDPEVVPRPQLVPDPVLGYRAKPGVYSLIFKREIKATATSPAKTETLVTKETIGSDGNRWLGGHVDNPKRPHVYIFGDSYIFGYGVNDEQTLAYLLQQNRKDLNVTLLANGGYGTVQAYINFERLKPSLKPEDVLIVGYTAFYKRRDVAAPSRLFEIGKPKTPTSDNPNNTAAKAALDANGQIKISYVPIYCKFSPDYCKQPDPPPAEMNRVTAALINHIARNTSAHVLLLHFGKEQDYYQQVPELHDPVPAMLDKRVQVIHAMNDEFGSFIRDDVAGFNSHPGPYWHYAMFTKLKEVLGQLVPRAAEAPAGTAPN
jgi:hypothetical protein